MKKFLFLTVIALTSALVLPVHAQTTKQFPEGAPEISITYPATWTEIAVDKPTNPDTSHTEMESPGKAIDFDLWSMKAEDIDTATKDVQDDMKDWLKNIKLDPSASNDITLGGIKFTAYIGTGDPIKAEDLSHGQQDVEAYFGSADGGKTVLIILYYGDKGAGDKFKDDLGTIVNSIKPVTP